VEPVREELPADAEAVYIPAQPVRLGEHVCPAVELYRHPDTGELIGLAFRSTGSLVAALGRWQPWISMGMCWYVALLRLHDIERVYVDPVSGHDPPGSWTAARLGAAVREFG
jgi:hypothetical protein